MNILKGSMDVKKKKRFFMDIIGNKAPFYLRVWYIFKRQKFKIKTYLTIISNTCNTDESAICTFHNTFLICTASL